MKKKSKKHVLFVSDKELFLLTADDTFSIKEVFKIEEVFSSPEVLKKEIYSVDIKLAIVPDYWIASRFYPISSKKHSIVETFLKRKLPIDLPEVPDCKDFFEYFPYEQQEQQGILVYLIQEPSFYHLYKGLFEETDLKITSLAFLWRTKIAKKIKNFNKGLKLFMHIYHSQSYLCFFLDFHFLFSRLISFEDSHVEQLSYELIQTFRLVTQRTKREVEGIYFISKEKKYKEIFTHFLSIDIQDISDQIDLSSPSVNLIEKLGSFAFLKKEDISETGKVFFISYRPLKEIKQWSFFQNIGIGVGIFVLLLMIAEAIFLNQIDPNVKCSFFNNDLIKNYIIALNEVLYHKEKPRVQIIFLRLLSCIPKEIQIKYIQIQPGFPSIIELKGNIEAFSVEDFQKKLNDLLKNIKNRFKNARLPTLRDIEIKRVSAELFQFDFKFELNER